jgi:hypothetical protein
MDISTAREGKSDRATKRRGRERQRVRERDGKRTTFGTFATAATRIRTVMNIYSCQGKARKLAAGKARHLYVLHAHVMA